MRRSSPAAARNREPIAAVLDEELPTAGLVLEVASGTGEHVVHFARRFPQLDWQPSDPDPDALASIAAWCEAEGFANIRPPLRLNAAAVAWPIGAAAAILCINMIHISPWAATLGLLQGAARLLQSGAPLILYGPYRREDLATAPSNEAFDQSLQARDPRWGLRRLEDVAAEAALAGFTLTRVVEMPANNLTLVFRRR